MYLGLDIGTSKTAAVIIEADGSASSIFSRAHGAELGAPAGRSEQDARKLLESAWTAVKGLPARERSAIKGIGITGQMHGVVVLDARGEPLTPLVTWQDGRCLEGDFLSGLIAQTGSELRSGFGCATLAWLAAYGALPAAAAHASAIHDLVAARLCGLAAPVIDPTDAAAWGLFDLVSLSWDTRAARAGGMDERLLPKVVPCGSVIGETSREMASELGIPAGIPVVAALGDNQASLVGTLCEPEVELALTLGTAGQLSAVLPAGTKLEGPEQGAHAWARPALPTGKPQAPTAAPAPRTWEYRPFPGGRFAVVAAALCGGSAWQWLAVSITQWMRDLNLPPISADTIFKAMNERGLAAEGTLVVKPRFLGERHDPGLRGTIEGISFDNFSLGGLSRALAAGIITNLRDMMPARFFEGRARVMGSGNAFARNALLRKTAEEIFNLPLMVGEVKEEAAVGAALHAARSIAG